MRPTDIRALVNLGIAQTNMGMFENAIQSFKQAIALNPRTSKPSTAWPSAIERKASQSKRFAT